MSLTLDAVLEERTFSVEELEEQVLEAFTDQQAADFLREFCTVCYTDNVSVRADGVIFCPECGNTTRS